MQSTTEVETQSTREASRRTKHGIPTVPRILGMSVLAMTVMGTLPGVNSAAIVQESADLAEEALDNGEKSAIADS